MADFFDLGGVAGFLALAWQGATALGKHRGRPILHVRPFDKKRDLAKWDMNSTGLVQKVLTFEVENVGKRVATRCVARLNVLKSPAGMTLARDVSMPLHWASTPYSDLDTGAQPVDIGSEPRRLDVVFTRNIQGSVGAWVAAPLALNRTVNVPQFHLPPGAYDAEVVLTCQDGDGCRVGLRINSPEVWDSLDADRTS